jgi:hypothetical protein
MLVHSVRAYDMMMMIMSFISPLCAHVCVILYTWRMHEFMYVSV